MTYSSTKSYTYGCYIYYKLLVTPLTFKSLALSPSQHTWIVYFALCDMSSVIIVSNFSSVFDAKSSLKLTSVLRFFSVFLLMSLLSNALRSPFILFYDVYIFIFPWLSICFVVDRVCGQWKQNKNEVKNWASINHVTYGIIV